MPRLSRRQLATRNKFRNDKGEFLNLNNQDTQEEGWSVSRNDDLRKTALISKIRKALCVK